MSETALQDTAGHTLTAGSDNNSGAGSNASTDADRFGYGGDWTSALLNPTNPASTSESDQGNNSGPASGSEGGEGRTATAADAASADFDVDAFLREMEQGGGSDNTDTATGDAASATAGDGGDEDEKIGNVPYARFREVNERAKAAAQLEAERNQWLAEKAQLEQQRAQEAEVLRNFGVTSIAEIPAAIEAYNRQQQQAAQYQQIQEKKAEIADRYDLSDDDRKLLLDNLTFAEQRLFNDAQLAQTQQQVQAQQEYITSTLRTQAINTVAANMPHLSDSQREILSYYDPADIPTIAASYDEYARAYLKAELPKVVAALQKKQRGTLTPEGRASGSTPQRNPNADARDPDSIGWTDALFASVNRRGSA